ncbi:MAG: metallophosphoesterase, partial [Chloroflexota bacterium]
MPDVLLRFVQISDTHLQPGIDHTQQPLLPVDENSPDPFVATINQIIMASKRLAPPEDAAQRIIAAINELPFDIDFVLHTGDIGFDVKTDDAYRQIKPLFDTCRFPIHFLPGNHDDSEAVQRVLGEIDVPGATYERIIPHERVKIVCLDTSQDELSAQQLAWFREQVNDPQDSRPLIVALHHNPVPLGSSFADRVMLKQHDTFRDILRQHRTRLKGVFYGHLHTALTTVNDGVAYYCCPGTWQQFDITPGVDETRGSNPA